MGGAGLGAAGCGGLRRGIGGTGGDGGDGRGLLSENKVTSRVADPDPASEKNFIREENWIQIRIRHNKIKYNFFIQYKRQYN